MKRKPKHRLLPFPDPPPQMDVEDPRWPDAFATWLQRKADWYGMEDGIELMARALGIKKPADEWVARRKDERRKEQKRLEDLSASGNAIYGKNRGNNLVASSENCGNAQEK